jgi:DNA-binding CsgD family transcriptional regulator
MNSQIERLSPDLATGSALSFSRREGQVVSLTLEGMSLKQMGIALGCSLKTIHSYRRRAMDKCGAHNVFELVRYASTEPLPRRAGSRTMGF